MRQSRAIDSHFFECAEAAIPACRIGEPHEIAATALFLASDLASFYYGQVLGPNGGAAMY